MLKNFQKILKECFPVTGARRSRRNDNVEQATVSQGLNVIACMFLEQKTNVETI